MDFLQCIENALAEGAITEDQANTLRATYRSRLDAERDLHGFSGEEMAARAAYEQLAFEAARRKRIKRLTLKAQQRLVYDTRGYRDELGRADMKQAGLALYDSAVFQGGITGLKQRYDAVRGLLHSHMARSLKRFERDLIGRTQNTADLDVIVDFLFGSSDIPAELRGMAEGMRETMELARRMFNDAGGAIPKLDRYGVPQLHDEEKILGAGFDAWRDFVLPLLDRDRMIDQSTGAPISNEALELALKDTFEAMKTDGWSRREVRSHHGGRALANRRLDHRFLHFVDGEAWRSYNRTYGKGDAWTAVLGYVDGMARDISLMQRFGPNPNAGAEYARQLLLKDAGMSGDLSRQNAMKSAVRDMETMHERFVGTSNVPDHPKTALFLGSVRQWLTSAQLGGAMLSAVSDVNFGRITAKFNGMSSARLMKRQLSMLNPANGADRQIAVRLGLIAEEASQIMSSYSRYFEEITAYGWTQRMADLTLKLSGLSAWTQAGRWAFGMEYLGTLADHVGRTFDELPQPLQDSLRRHGLASDWDRIRSTELLDHKGGMFLDPSRFEDQDLGIRVIAALKAETEFAVPSVSLYGRSKFLGDTRPGSISGELMRNTMMYKSFGTTLALTHGRRAAMQSGWHKKIGYAGSLVVTTSILGALSIQLKDIAKGRDPRDADNSAFWMASLVQGGGMGIFGDFLFQDTNRYGGGFGETIAGPVAGLLTDVHALTLGNMMELSKGSSLEDAGVADEASRMVERYTPIASSLWYTRLATQRLIFDQIRNHIDPKVEKRRAGHERTVKKNFGSDYWWEAGDVKPERAPDLN